MISSLFISERENGSLGYLLHTFIANMLGCFLYFRTHFKTRSLMLLARGSKFEYSALLRLLIMLEKSFLFETLEVLYSTSIIFSLSINVILSVDVTLSDKKGLMALIYRSNQDLINNVALCVFIQVNLFLASLYSIWI